MLFLILRSKAIKILSIRDSLVRAIKIRHLLTFSKEGGIRIGNNQYLKLHLNRLNHKQTACIKAKYTQCLTQSQI
jgi:hypothetical protein